jgi:bifunctional non-homologous end joining protein LigD
MLWRVPPARSRRTPRAGFIHPAQPRLVDKPPAGPDWTHEVKQDGFRLLARKEGQRVTLWTRHGTKFTDRLPRIAEAVRGLPVENLLIDGEAVALRPDGHSNFEALRTKAGAATAAYVAFDLMQIGGKDIRQHRIEDRRAELQRIVKGADAIVFSESIAGEGGLVFKKACEMGLEGIVSKRVGSIYWSGRARNWTKAINPAFQKKMTMLAWLRSLAKAFLARTGNPIASTPRRSMSRRRRSTSSPSSSG